MEHSPTSDDSEEDDWTFRPPVAALTAEEAATQARADQQRCRQRRLAQKEADSERYVLVKWVGKEAKLRDVRMMFERCGDTVEVRLPKAPPQEAPEQASQAASGAGGEADTQAQNQARHCGVAFIEYEDASSAHRALKLTGKKLGGTAIDVSYQLRPRNSNIAGVPCQTKCRYLAERGLCDLGDACQASHARSP